MALIAGKTNQLVSLKAGARASVRPAPVRRYGAAAPSRLSLYCPCVLRGAQVRSLQRITTSLSFPVRILQLILWPLRAWRFCRSVQVCAKYGEQSKYFDLQVRTLQSHWSARREGGVCSRNHGTLAATAPPFTLAATHRLVVPNFSVELVSRWCCEARGMVLLTRSLMRGREGKILAPNRLLGDQLPRLNLSDPSKYHVPDCSGTPSCDSAPPGCLSHFLRVSHSIWASRTHENT